MVIIQIKALRKLGILATTIYPFVFVANTRRFLAEPMNIFHEQVHARQQIEMLIVPFYVWYIIEFAIRACRVGWSRAYYRISFEQEAFANEHDPGYAKNRKLFGWVKFLKN